MRIPWLRPVVPPHVFCLTAEGVTYARVRREEPVGFAEARPFAYPAGSVGSSASGTPLFTREALSEAVTAARRLSEERLSRACVVFPDAWARILPIDLDAPPASEEAAREMVRWKLKKLLPGVTSELAVSFGAMPPPSGGGTRLLVAAAPAESLRSIEQSFESFGVRVGLLSPASLALFEGLARRLGVTAGGDYGILHRTAGSLSFLIARDGQPLFFRQRPSEEGVEEHVQELRLSLSYYAEKLQGPGLLAVYVHDELQGGDGFPEQGVFPVPASRLSGRVFGADAGFDERIAVRPELMAGFAAAWGGPGR